MNDLDIKQIRAKIGLTQAELAKMVGVTEATIQNWERGKKIPTTKHTTLRSCGKVAPLL